jgi:hypothetical protein
MQTIAQNYPEAFQVHKAHDFSRTVYLVKDLLRVPNKKPTAGPSTWLDQFLHFFNVTAQLATQLSPLFFYGCSEAGTVLGRRGESAIVSLFAPQEGWRFSTQS